MTSDALMISKRASFILGELKRDTVKSGDIRLDLLILDMKILMVEDLVDIICNTKHVYAGAVSSDLFRKEILKLVAYERFIKKQNDKDSKWKNLPYSKLLPQIIKIMPISRLKKIMWTWEAMTAHA